MTIEQVKNLKKLCHQFFNANCLLLDGVTSSVFQTSNLHKKLGHGLGLNLMQGREAKHAKYWLSIWKTHAMPKRASGGGLCSDMSLIAW